MKPNRSRSGAASRPARVVAPTRVNGGQLERDGGGARALADHDVDPEVLHRHVEHLLGGPGDAVDLVDEQHLALVERGQDGGEVAGVLDRRAGGDPQRHAQLGRDDHRQRGLAQPGRAGQQQVLGGDAARGGGLQHQPELLAHHRLPDEVRQPPGPQRRLGGPLQGVGARAHDPGAEVGQVLLRHLDLDAAVVVGDQVGRTGRRDGSRGSATSAPPEVAQRGAQQRALVGGAVGRHGLDRGLGLLGVPAEPDQRLDDVGVGRRTTRRRPARRRPRRRGRRAGR